MLPFRLLLSATALLLLPSFPHLAWLNGCLFPVPLQLAQPLSSITWSTSKAGGDITSPTEIALFCVAGFANPKRALCRGSSAATARAGDADHQRPSRAGVVGTGRVEAVVGSPRSGQPVTRSASRSSPLGNLPRRAGSGGWAMRRIDSAMDWGAGLACPAADLIGEGRCLIRGGRWVAMRVSDLLPFPGESNRSLALVR